MGSLKYETSSPKFYELLIKNKIKGDTDMDLKNFYNHTRIGLNTVTILQEDLFPGKKSIKIHSDFGE